AFFGLRYHSAHAPYINSGIRNRTWAVAYSVGGLEGCKPSPNSTTVQVAPIIPLATPDRNGKYNMPAQPDTTEWTTDMPIDESRFRQALGYFATGVTVVTTAYGGELYGMTVSSFSSLSLSPPLVLICVDKAVPTHDALRDAGQFVVNILEKRQEHLSRRFAMPGNDKFKGVAWHSGTLG